MSNTCETVGEFPPLPPVRRRSKRLQKKLHVGEYKEYGFAVSFHLRESLSPKDSDEFWSSFIEHLIDKRGLAFGGGEEGYITRYGTGSATEEDREAVSFWLQKHPQVVRVVIGPLEDAWYRPGKSAP
ncbi:MAG: YggL family protein [Nitrosomonadales bacterium]|nr:YggL family protein [Nitrosomonadales bacterium]